MLDFQSMHVTPLLTVAEDGLDDATVVYGFLAAREAVTATPKAAERALAALGMSDEAIKRRFRFAKTGSFDG